MQLSENLSKVLTDIVEPLTRIAGIELVDIEVRKEGKQTVLDIVIDREGGISVDDCADISRKVSLALDIEDPIPFRYVLEVGSPGIFRTLKSEKEIQRNLQARVKAVFFEPVMGQSTFVGILSRFQDRKVVLQRDSEELEVDLLQIKKIQLFPDI